MKQLWCLLLLLTVLCVTAACARPPTVQPTRGNPTKPGEIAAPVTVAVTPAPTLPASPAYAGTYAGTPTPNPTPAGHSDASAVESYVVQTGQTLSWIATMFDTTVDEIVTANGLPDADSVSVGQTIIIPVTAARTGRALKVIPDSELVYGPAYIHFDLAGFVAGQEGYLASYSEEVEGRLLTGAEIVRLVSQRLSVGPRVLLALLELQAGWVTRREPAAGTLVYPLGHVEGYYEGLYQQLSWASVRLNKGYYGWKWGGQTTMRLADGTRAATAPELNPGTAGVQNCLAELSATWDEWVWLTGPSGFPSTYARLFGSPFAYTVEPLVPPDLAQLELQLPWESGHTWYFTSGPHGGWGEGSDRSALDFAPSEEHLGCTPSADWITAAAPGLVVRSDEGEVLLDIDGDGFVQSGWVLFYLHVYSEQRVGAGTYVERGQRIGHPSCEGGYSMATHLHFARRYNGEWIPAGRGPVPMVLSGWTTHDGATSYEGTMTQGELERTALERWDDDLNGLTLDAGP